jgi:hypothetical protein
MSVYIEASEAEACADGPHDEDARPGTSPTPKLGGMFRAMSFSQERS